MRRAGSVATLSVEGRACAARALPGSAVGRASGLVALAQCGRGVADAVGWMPGRILVLSDAALSPPCLRWLLSSTDLTNFAGVVVLADDASQVGPLAAAGAGIPMVLVSRGPDRERVRRAVRVSIEVAPATRPVAPVPPPRPAPNRRSASNVTASTVPGTIDLRARYG